MQIELFDKYKVGTNLITQCVKKSRETERGNLMKELMENINVTRKGKFRPLTMPRMGLILQNIPTDALYVLSSKCKQEAERKKEKYFETYSKIFWYEIIPKN